MSDRNGFVIYENQIDALMEMPGDIAIEALDAMRKYALKGETYEGDNLTVKIFLALVKPQIDANTRKYENGKKGGRPKAVIPMPEYIEQQKNGKLPKSKKATAETIEAVKKLQEKMG